MLFTLDIFGSVICVLDSVAFVLFAGLVAVLGTVNVSDGGKQVRE